MCINCFNSINSINVSSFNSFIIKYLYETHNSMKTAWSTYFAWIYPLYELTEHFEWGPMKIINELKMKCNFVGFFLSQFNWMRCYSIPFFFYYVFGSRTHYLICNEKFLNWCAYQHASTKFSNIFQIFYSNTSILLDLWIWF